MSELSCTEPTANLKLVLELNSVVYRLQKDLETTRQQVRLLLCQCVRTHKGDKQWDFDILSDQVTMNSAVIRDHSNDIADFKKRIADIETQYHLIVKDDVSDFNTFMTNVLAIDDVLNEHRHILEVLSEKVALCNCQLQFDQINELQDQVESLQSLQLKAEELDTLISDYTNGFTSLLDNVSVIKSDIEDIKEKIEPIPDLKNDIELLKIQYQNLELKEKELEDATTELTNRVTVIENRLGIMDNVINQIQCQIRDLQTKDIEQDRRIDNINPIICELQAKVEELYNKCIKGM